jgi:hypothetical protein
LLFDGWEIPEGKSVIAEAYPSLSAGVSQGMAGTAMSKPPTLLRHSCNAPTAAIL